MIPIAKTVEIMGGNKVLHARLDSPNDLRQLIVKGLPKKALKETLSHVVSGKELSETIFSIIPEATYKRRKTVLASSESEKVERLARVIATSHYVWDDDELSVRFLKTPHPFLNNEKPLIVAYSELGARQVEELLWSIFYGIPS